jgi:histone H3/H4
LKKPDLIEFNGFFFSKAFFYTFPRPNSKQKISSYNFERTQVEMADQKISELTLPLAVIQRLIKEALPPNAIAKNEAKLGISKAASVFVLFLTSGKIYKFLKKF